LVGGIGTRLKRHLKKSQRNFCEAQRGEASKFGRRRICWALRANGCEKLLTGFGDGRRCLETNASDEGPVVREN